MTVRRDLELNDYHRASIRALAEYGLTTVVIGGMVTFLPETRPFDVPDLRVRRREEGTCERVDSASVEAHRETLRALRDYKARFLAGFGNTAVEQNDLTLARLEGYLLGAADHRVGMKSATAIVLADISAEDRDLILREGARLLAEEQRVHPTQSGAVSHVADPRPIPRIPLSSVDKCTSSLADPASPSWRSP